MFFVKHLKTDREIVEHQDVAIHVQLIIDLWELSWRFLSVELHDDIRTFPLEQKKKKRFKEKQNFELTNIFVRIGIVNLFFMRIFLFLYCIFSGHRRREFHQNSFGLFLRSI